MDAQPDNTAAEWTIGRLLKWTSDYLTTKGVDEARLATEVMLSHAVRCRRIDLYARFEDTLHEPKLGHFREWVRRAADHEPIGYLVEEKEFYSLPFKITRDVLIPRPETELLVECAIDHCAGAGLEEPHLLDLGTGSGCVVVAALVHLSKARAIATDISPTALEVARFNAERHGVLDRLTLIEADRLALPREALPRGGINLLLSNPPYIADEEVAGLHASVKDFEPFAALSDGADGLSFYRSIASDAPGLLSSDGVVIVEVGDGQAAAVITIIEEGGSLLHRESRKDRVVGKERVLTFTLRPTG